MVTAICMQGSLVYLALEWPCVWFAEAYKILQVSILIINCSATASLGMSNSILQATFHFVWSNHTRSLLYRLRRVRRHRHDVLRSCAQWRQLCVLHHIWQSLPFVIALSDFRFAGTCTLSESWRQLTIVISSRRDSRAAGPHTDFSY